MHGMKWSAPDPRREEYHLEDPARGKVELAMVTPKGLGYQLEVHLAAPMPTPWIRWWHLEAQDAAEATAQASTVVQWGAAADWFVPFHGQDLAAILSQIPHAR